MDDDLAPASPKCICLHAGGLTAITTGAALVAVAFGVIAIVCFRRRLKGTAGALASQESTLIAGITSLLFATLGLVLRSMPACNNRTFLDRLKGFIDIVLYAGWGIVGAGKGILDIVVKFLGNVSNSSSVVTHFARFVGCCVPVGVAWVVVIAWRHATGMPLPAMPELPTTAWRLLAGTWCWPPSVPSHKEDGDAPARRQVPIAPPTYVGENMVSLRSRVSDLLGERCMPSKDLMKLPRAKLVAYCAESGLPRQ